MKNLYFKYYFIFFIFYPVLLVNAQTNLVPNYSFEEYSLCPDGMTRIEYAVPWFSPCHPHSTSEFYHTCSNDFNITYMMNMQTPRTGNGYAAIVFGKGDYREYIEVKLNDSLIAGKKYCVEFYVSLMDSAKFGIDAIGAYFSKDSILDTLLGIAHPPLLLYQSQINNPTGNIIIDTDGWTRIYGEFTAMGGEQYMTIGNFYETEDINYIEIEGGGHDAYYYIDDVSVYYCDEDTSKNDIFMPNTFTPNGDELNDQYYAKGINIQTATITIYNRWGNSIYTGNALAPGWNGKTNTGKNAPTGVYFGIVNVKFRNNQTKQYKTKINLIR